MGGCLGPARDVLPIYIDLIDQVYTEAERVEIQESPGLHIYEQIRDRVNKKGLLRKLSEYLLVHRTFLNESMQHNFRLMRQRKSFLGRVTSLVVIDHLIENLERFVQRPVQPRSVKVQRRGQHQHVQNQAFDVRFEMIFFQVALELYDSEVRLRAKLLSSIIDFAKKHQQKFSCDQLVGQLLERLVELAKSSSGDRALCTATFARLIEHSNEAIEDRQVSQESLRVFLAVWMETDEQPVRRSCQQIIRDYIDRCMTAREYGFIYLVIFQVYDQNCFRQARLAELEDQLLLIIKEEDLKDQFLKGMYRHLLTYLCACQNDDVRAKWDHGLFDRPYETVRRSYPNILKKESKHNGFLTLHRWATKNFINLVELVTYSRTALVSCFTFNLCAYIDDRQVVDWLIAVFFKMVDLFDEGCLVMVVELLIEEIHQSRQGSVEEGWLLIRIVKKCIDEHGVIENASGDQLQNMLKPLEVALPSRIKNQLLVLTCTIIDGCSKPLSLNVLQPLVGLLYSLFDSLKKPESVKEKYFFTCSLLTLLRKLKEKEQTELLVVFIDQVEQQQSQHAVPLLERYMCRVLACETYEMLAASKQVFEEMKKLNLKIHTPIENTQLMSEIEGFLVSYPSWPQLPTAYQQELKRHDSSTRRTENIKRLFERQSKRELRVDELQIDFRATNCNNNGNSVISQRSSGRTDESFHNVLGLIRDPSENMDDQRKSRSGWPSTASEDRKHRTLWNVRTN